MSKIKNGGLDQYGALNPFEQQQFGIAGAEGVNASRQMDCMEDAGVEISGRIGTLSASTAFRRRRR